MSTRISYLQGFLFSNIEITPADYDYEDEYEYGYGSAEKCFEHFKIQIIEDCLTQGYNDFEIKAVLDHFKVKIFNTNCKLNRLMADGVCILLR